MNIQIDTTNTTIETQRLLLRAFTSADADDFYAYARVPGVGEMAGWPHHESIETTRKVLSMFLAERNVFAIVDKASGHVIGSLGLHASWANEDPRYQHLRLREIGYVLSKDYWGQGLVPEAVQAVIRHYTATGELQAFACCHFTSNQQSRRVIEKCGFTFCQRDIYHAAQLSQDIEEMQYILLCQPA